MIENFIRFFDKSGSDMNLAKTTNTLYSLYNGSKVVYESLKGKLFFPEVSVGLIESQNLYLLQEVTGPTSFQLRKLPGKVTTLAGNPIVSGLGTRFTELSINDQIEINGTNFQVISVSSDTSFTVTPTPAFSITTEDFYYKDYVTYNELRSTPGTFLERVTVKFPEKEIDIKQKFTEQPYFIYEVDYSEDLPYIQKGVLASYDLKNGTNDTIDLTTGRISLSEIETVPLQINIGISSNIEYIYENQLEITKEKEYRYSLSQTPISSIESISFTINGLNLPFYDISSFYIVGGTGTANFYEKQLKISSVSTSGSETIITVEFFDSPISSSNFSNFYLKVVNSFNLANLDLYGEVIGEDERLKITLQNFGKKIDYDKEFIFRESDINEALPDYRILNNKRKELLLEGDNIYPYLGSYRALINIINYFGYYDLRIKEYFLNVDEDSSNYGNYMHALIPKNEKQRKEVKDIWRAVPSKIYKKTSLFGLFYDLNKTTENVDIYGIPEVVDSFDFSPEEVLIKLFGLKELLKKEYLPLNARIYDITGEGIYFQRISVNSWSDNLHHLTLDLGKRPEFKIFPEESYISDARRIDSFYVQKFIEQGLTGFMGAVANDPSINALNYTGPISSIYNSSLSTYDNFPTEIYDSNGNLLPILDNTWEFMPPSINNTNFNQISSRLTPLPDDKDVISGAPILLESFFNISWEEAIFNWSQLSILGPTGSPVNINLWTWDSIGRGEYIDMRWTVEKHGENGFFYDSGRKPIESFSVNVQGENRILHALLLPYEGEYDIALYNYDITNNYTVEFQKRIVKTKEVDFVSVFKKETSERKWEDFQSINWKEVTGPWYYPLHIESFWENAKVSWESLEFSSYKDQSLFEYNLDTDIYKIDRNSPYVELSGNLLGNLSNSLEIKIGDFLFFTRESADTIKENLHIPVDSFDSFLKGLIGLTESNALVSGISGNNFIDATPFDLTGYISSGDSVWVNGNWYKVNSVLNSIINLETTLLNSFTSQNALTYNSNNEIFSSFSGTVLEMKRYSRLLVTTNCKYTSINPSIDFYEYVNSLSFSGSTFSFTEKEEILRKIIEENSSLIGNNDLYVTWGLFSGTYAIEITNLSQVGQNTLIRLKDPNKELYYLDGNFNVEISSYDIDYAETRIGTESLKFGNIDEYTWEENPSLTWNGTEFHEGALCGFIIPFVAPGGSITIDEEPSFFFSGDINIQSTKSGLQVALQELINSENTGISKYTYDVLPDDEIYITDSNLNNLSFSSSIPVGATSASLSGIPGKGSLKIPAEISVVVSGGSIVSVNIDNPGYGYSTTPQVTIPEPCGGTASVITLQMTGLPFEGTVIGATWSGGSGYDTNIDVIVSPPQGYKVGDNYIWTGTEWVKVVNVSGNIIEFENPITVPVNSGVFPLLPYNYHKQLFLNPALMQQFYYFIQGKAKNPSNEMLSYINFTGGVESEWTIYPDRTYTYPLRNSILFNSLGDNLEYDHLYQKWIYEGEDYPPLNVYPEYDSDLLSNESRVPFSSITQSPFSFIDTVISNNQQKIFQNTPVVFHYDTCKIPGKNSPKWTITNEDTGKIQVISDSNKLMWNFTVSGNFSVSLILKDSNGNVSSKKKNSFLIVE